MIVYDKEQKQIVIPNGLGNVNIIINQGCDDDKPTPPQDGWGMTGYFNNWGGTPDIPFEENGEWEGRPYKVIRGFEATGSEFKIRRNNAWTNSYTANFHNEPQFAKLQKADWNMPINDGVWDIYLFFRNDGEPNEMLVLNPGTDLSTIKYEYTLTISTDKENAIIDIDDSYEGMGYRYYGGVTVTMKYGCTYTINVHMEGYEDISDEITCYNDEERNYTLTKIEGGGCNLGDLIKEITENGNYVYYPSNDGLDGYKMADIRINVPQEGGGCTLTTRTITQNGTYRASDGYSIPVINFSQNGAFDSKLKASENATIEFYFAFKDERPDLISFYGSEDSDWQDTTFAARYYSGDINVKIGSFERSFNVNEYGLVDGQAHKMKVGKTYGIEIGGQMVATADEIANGIVFTPSETRTIYIGAINSPGIEDNGLGLFWRPFNGFIGPVTIYGKKENGEEVTYNYEPGDYGWLGEYKIVETDQRIENINRQEGATPLDHKTYNTNADGYSEVTVNVPDLNGSYDEGYTQGKIDGANEQKSKLESINITENGTYTKEDGYNHIEVNVPDLNGSYDEGYKKGQGDILAYIRTLNVTENGVYKSKYSDSPEPTVTGVYDNGTNFYHYAELSNKIFNTKIAATIDSRLEFWYKGDNKKNTKNNNVIIGSGNDNDNNSFQVRYDLVFNDRIRIHIGDKSISITKWKDGDWHHLIISKAEGLWIDGEKKGDFSPTNAINGEFFINGIGYKADGKSSANGAFGMIKIDDVVIIPTEDGFQNVNTGELLEVVNDGGYNYVGDLYRTIEVNVVPKISIKEAGLNVWYNDLTRITDENVQINSDWDLALQGETIQNVFPGIAMTISGQAVAKPFFIDAVNGNSTAIKIGKLVSSANGTPVSCAVVIIGAFDCKNIQTVDLEAFKYMTDLCYIDGMKGLGESFTSPQTIDFTYCTNLFIKGNVEKFIPNFAESLFNLSAGNKNGINTSTLKFNSAVQERSGNADDIALMQSKGWTVEFV